jgi:hypothetical protein
MKLQGRNFYQIAIHILGVDKNNRTKKRKSCPEKDKHWLSVIF